MKYVPASILFRACLISFVTVSLFVVFHSRQPAIRNVEPQTATEATTGRVQAQKQISFDQLGATAAQQMNPEAFAIRATSDGATLNSALQDMKGSVNPFGLTVTSLAKEGRGGSFSLWTASLLRKDGTRTPMDANGTVSVKETFATLDRGSITEEFRTSGDGLRQDFIVLSKPKGTGKLVIRSTLSGATAKLSGDSIELSLKNSHRQLVYTNLHVTDALGKVVPARLAIHTASTIDIEVDDMLAAYPIRIDPTISDANWQGIGGQLPGFDGLVNALAYDSVGNLYVGGSFTHAAGTPVNDVAKWDGSSWSSLGSGMDNSVFALVIDGSDDLYAGGLFTSAGGVLANRVAKWDGTSWSAIGTGTDDGVYSLALSTSSLYVGGNFTTAGGVAASNVARWDGASWSALGAGTNNTVYALAVNASGTLFAGGSFTDADGSYVGRIAKWNGVAWSTFDANEFGVNNTVYSIAIDASNVLYIGGDFNVAVSNGAQFLVPRVIKWIAPNWVPLGLDFSNGGVRAIGFDHSGTLYAGGNFSRIGGVFVDKAAKWDGSSWSQLGSAGFDSNDVVSALASDPSNRVTIGGSFVSVGTVVNNIASVNGASWNAFGGDLNGPIRALTLDASNNLYVGGPFTLIGGVAVQNLAKWDGSNWSDVSGGANAEVDALVTDHLNNVYAGGQFSEIGGLTTTGIAKWDGSVWSSLGTGAGGPVYALAVDATSSVYASVGSLVIQWDGTQWSVVGDGDGMDDLVRALAVDAAGTVYAGGDFSLADDANADYVAAWNGASWGPLGGGMSDPVYVLQVDSKNNLYAGGQFTSAGGVSANHIAMWDGSAWSALGNGMDAQVSSLEVDPADNVFAGGLFSTAGDVAASGIAIWNGSTWAALGSGLTNGDVSSLAVAPSGILYAGGSFTGAGGKNAPYIAQGIFTYTLNYASGPNGSLVGAASQSLDAGSDGSAVTAVPDVHYHFVSWSDASTTNPRTDTNVTSDISVTSTFAIDTRTLTYIAGAHGSISGASPQTVDYGSSGSQVTAVPDANSHFTSWSDGVLTSSRTDANVVADQTVTANFALDTLTLSYSADAHGSVSTSTQVVDFGSDGSSVSALPDVGFHFLQWSDLRIDNPRTDLNVTANLSVSAAFEPDPISGSVRSGGGGGGGSPEVAAAPLMRSTPLALILDHIESLQNGLAKVWLKLNADPNTVRGYGLSINANDLGPLLSYHPLVSLVVKTTQRIITIYGRYYSTTGQASALLSLDVDLGSLPPGAPSPSIPPSSPPPISITPTKPPSQSPGSVDTPTSAPLCPVTFFYRDLKSGSSGNDVKQLQIFLNTHGFTLGSSGFGSRGRETTTYDGRTSKALKLFQTAHKFPANGIFAGVTRSLVQSLVPRIICPIPLKFPRDLRLGMSGEDVQRLQIFLNTHGYLIAISGPGSKGAESTSFSRRTEAALKLFQRANGFSPDGILEDGTRARLNEIQ